MEETSVDRRGDGIDDGRPTGRQGSASPRSRALAAEVAVGHRDGSVHEIAEVVGEVGVVAPDEAVPAHLRVAVERHFTQDDVARAVAAEGTDEVGWIEEVAAAFAHPLATGGQQPAVGPDTAGRL